MSVSVKKVATGVSMVLAAAALLVPVNVSPTDGVTANEACADGSCCAELMSLCGTDDPLLDYYASTGPCKETVQ